MHTVLETERLTLRPFDAADAESVLAVDSDPEVMRYLNGGHPVAREEVVRETMPRLLRRHPLGAAPSGPGYPGYWAAEERVSGGYLGWFEFRPVDGESWAEVELGYRLGRAAWGRGLATEGARALLRLGFTTLGVERVVATTMTVNTRSRRVLEKTGLRWVRTFFEEWPERIEGSEQGDVEYAVTRAEWLREVSAGGGR
ncbi:GNAT family N-acetyltransferase [Streptomyces sp. NPDC005805]|uniref:GNAT family N-acetyltransferase n=1 Tax=Streptomyces sp. NPDC005805 TaxID=3157068 RepID=UPI0033EA7113